VLTSSHSLVLTSSHSLVLTSSHSLSKTALARLVTFRLLTYAAPGSFHLGSFTSELPAQYLSPVPQCSVLCQHKVYICPLSTQLSLSHSYVAEGGWDVEETWPVETTSKRPQLPVSSAPCVHTAQKQMSGTQSFCLEALLLSGVVASASAGAAKCLLPDAQERA